MFTPWCLAIYEFCVLTGVQLFGSVGQEILAHFLLTCNQISDPFLPAFFQNSLIILMNCWYTQRYVHRERPREEDDDRVHIGPWKTFKVLIWSHTTHYSLDLIYKYIYTYKYESLKESRSSFIHNLYSS